MLQVTYLVMYLHVVRYDYHGCNGESKTRCKSVEANTGQYVKETISKLRKKKVIIKSKVLWDFTAKAIF